MARELWPVDVSDQPELRRPAEEVHATQEPRVLRRNNEDLAILRPARKTQATRSKGTSQQTIHCGHGAFQVTTVAGDHLMGRGTGTEDERAGGERPGRATG